MSFSENLKALRKCYGLSQTELSALSGVNPATISKYENNYTGFIRHDKLDSLAAALGVTAQDLMSDDPPDLKQARLTKAKNYFAKNIPSKALSAKIRSSLAASGIRSIGQLVALSAYDLAAVPGIPLRSVPTILNFISDIKFGSEYESLGDPPVPDSAPMRDQPLSFAGFKYDTYAMLQGDNVTTIGQIAAITPAVFLYLHHREEYRMEEIQGIIDEISAAEQAREQGQQDETLPTGKITQFTIRQVESKPRYSHEPYDEILTADAESVSYRFHSDIEEKYHPTDWSYRTARYDYRSDYDAAQRKLRLLLKHYPEKEFIKTDDAPDLYIDAAFEDGTVVSRHFRLPTHRTYKVFIDFYKALERLAPFRELPPYFTKNVWR